MNLSTGYSGIIATNTWSSCCKHWTGLQLFLVVQPGTIATISFQGVWVPYICKESIFDQSTVPYTIVQVRVQILILILRVQRHNPYQPVQDDRMKQQKYLIGVCDLISGSSGTFCQKLVFLFRYRILKTNEFFKALNSISLHLPSKLEKCKKNMEIFHITWYKCVKNQYKEELKRFPANFCRFFSKQYLNLNKICQTKLSFDS